MLFIAYDVLLCRNQKGERYLLNYHDLYSQIKQLINAGYIPLGILNEIYKTMYRDMWVKIWKNKTDYIDATWCKGKDMFKDFIGEKGFKLSRCSKAVLHTCIEGNSIEDLLSAEGRTDQKGVGLGK